MHYGLPKYDGAIDCYDKVIETNGNSSIGSSLTYYSVNCRIKHNQTKCPKRGSKIKSWYFIILLISRNGY